MQTSHSIISPGPEIAMASASTFLPLYGRWTRLSFTVNTVRRHGFPATTINFGLRAANDADNFRGRLSRASNDGKLSIYYGDGGHKRQVEQVVDIPNLSGTIMEFSYLHDGGEAAGRIIAQAFLRQMESILESIRRSIRQQLAPSICDSFIVKIDSEYGEHTRDALDNFLKGINWKMLLMRSGCDERCGNVADFSLLHNEFRHHPLSVVDTEIKPFDYFAPAMRFENPNIEDQIREAHEREMIEADRQRRERAEKQHKEMLHANATAVELLASVCGQANADIFAKSGHVPLEHDGYNFKLRAGHFHRCTDPNGKTADLCIHTRSFSCNQIDEIVIAYLTIKNDFRRYMRMAVAHGAARGFIQDPAKVKKSRA